MTLPRLRAPADDGGVLAVPRLDSLGEFIASNRVRLAGLDDVRKLAVAEAVAEAVAYHRECDQPVPIPVSKGLIVAGHQPDLFHPGVWFKNFALGALARAHRLTALNIIADTDTLKTPSIRIPAGVGSADPRAIHLASLSYDTAAGEVPFEDRTVRDEGHFADFADRLGEATRSWSDEPFAGQFWPCVLAQRSRTNRVGERLAAARRAVERRWGLGNLELPTSRLARTPSFGTFVASILHDLPAFHAAYNACIADYRHTHRIRSRNHPVPNLGRDGDWLETPFWGWRSGAARRGRLFARTVGQCLELRASGEEWPCVPDERNGIDLEPLEAHGFKLRPRALTLTMFTRLYLADVFVHGIGGGKYDELTDAIIARHFDVTPPTFLVLTGTLRLPFAGYSSTERDVHRLERRARDLRWNPQRHMPPGSGCDAELGRRYELQIAKPTDDAAKRERYVKLREVSNVLAPAVAPQLAAVEAKLAGARSEVAANAVLRRRDYSFVLFPEARLRDFLTSSTAPPVSPLRPTPP